MLRRRLRLLRHALTATVTLVLLLSFLSACGGSNTSSRKATTEPVFELHPGQCLVPPKANPNFQVSTVEVVPCTEPHTEEVYCVLPYAVTLPQSPPRCPARPPRFAGRLVADYPGMQALEAFANAVCLDEFEPYVGTSYHKSSLYYTFLYPSPRSWDSPRRDRMVTCIVVDSSSPLRRSVKGSRL
jgi:hypothetical protein